MGKGEKEHETPMRMIETSNFSHCSRVIYYQFFRSTLKANRLGDKCGYRRSAWRASGILIIVSRKEQLLVTGKVRFVSVETSTPEKPVGTFVPNTLLLSPCNSYERSYRFFWS